MLFTRFEISFRVSTIVLVKRHFTIYFLCSDTTIVFDSNFIFKYLILIYSCYFTWLLGNFERGLLIRASFDYFLGRKQQRCCITKRYVIQLIPIYRTDFKISFTSIKARQSFRKCDRSDVKIVPLTGFEDLAEKVFFPFNFSRFFW